MHYMFRHLCQVAPNVLQSSPIRRNYIRECTLELGVFEHSPVIISSIPFLGICDRIRGILI